MLVLRRLLLAFAEEGPPEWLINRSRRTVRHSPRATRTGSTRDGARAVEKQKNVLKQLVEPEERLQTS